MVKRRTHASVGRVALAQEGRCENTDAALFGAASVCFGLPMLRPPSPKPQPWRVDLQKIRTSSKAGMEVATDGAGCGTSVLVAGVQQSVETEAAALVELARTIWTPPTAAWKEVSEFLRFSIESHLLGHEGGLYYAWIGERMRRTSGVSRRLGTAFEDAPEQLRLLDAEDYSCPQGDLFSPIPIRETGLRFAGPDGSPEEGGKIAIVTKRGRWGGGRLGSRVTTTACGALLERDEEMILSGEIPAMTSIITPEFNWAPTILVGRTLCGRGSDGATYAERVHGRHITLHPESFLPLRSTTSTDSMHSILRYTLGIQIGMFETGLIRI